jgi:hypothetical protein
MRSCSQEGRKPEGIDQGNLEQAPYSARTLNLGWSAVLKMHAIPSGIAAFFASQPIPIRSAHICGDLFSFSLDYPVGSQGMGRLLE